MQTVHRAAFIGWLALLSTAASAALPMVVSASPGLLPGDTGVDYASRQPTFRWTPIGNATWYQIWCDANPASGAPITQWIAGWATSSWTLPADRKLTKGKAYRWWVRGWSPTHGYGPWSDGRSFTAQEMVSILIPASAFRPISSSTAWQFVENGNMLSSSGTGSADFVAPVPAPIGVHLAKATLRWKNQTDNAGHVWCSVRLVSNLTGAGLSLWNLTSTESYAGVRTTR